MTDKELIQALRCCTSRPDCDKCAEECVFYKGNDVEGCVPDMGVTVSNRMEALLAENAEMNIQIQKEICKRVDVETENERLSEELRATERAAELLNHANAILKEQNEHLRETTKMMPKWVSVSERLPEEYRNEYGELKCYLVCTEDCVEPFRAFYDGKHWGDGWMVLDVTHWMPLPELPSTEGVE